MASRFSVEAVFKAVDRVSAPVTRMQNRVNKMTRSMGRGFDKLNRNVDKFTNGIKKGAVAVTAALVLTTGAMGNVINTGAEFEQTLVSAAAKFPGEIRKGTESFKQLEEAARQTGKTTEFTATQSAQALNFLAMAGFNAEQSIAALPGVVDLATAASVDLATATDVATDSLGAFGLMTKDATKLSANLARVNDVIAKTTTSANTTVETLFETIKDGAPVATSAGASLETFAALAGELANAGIKGSKAGTTLKNMFLSLSAPGTGAAKILKRMGIQTQDANGDMRDIVDILGDLNGALDGLGTAQRSGVLEGIFGKIPIAGVNVLLKSGSKRLREYRKELEGASGASSVMASVMRDTLQGRLNSLSSAVEGVKISIFSMTEGPLSDTVDKMTEWVRANEAVIATNIGGFISSLIENFSTIVVWIERIGKGLAIFVAFSIVLKTLIGIMTLVNLVMAANPIGLIVIAVAALIAGLIALGIWLNDVTDGFKGWGDIILDMLGPLGLLIKGVKFLMENGVSGAFDKISGFLGFGGDDGEGASDAAPAPQMISPQERIAKSVEERRTTSTAEVTIKDETGKAVVTQGTLGTGLKMQASGAF